ncbi:Uncharacterised protein [Mycobacteroides abscessus]|nr:Uncharacterised protein [Mycobacteroides abscessus]
MLRRWRSGAGATPPNSGLCAAWMNSDRTRMSDRMVPSVSWLVPYIGSTTTCRSEPRTASTSMIRSIASTYGSVSDRSTTTPVRRATSMSSVMTSSTDSAFASSW